MGKRADAVWCSKRCGQLAANAAKADRVKADKAAQDRRCVVCGTPIDPARRVGTRYCSEKCVQDRRGHVNNAARRIKVGDLPATVSRREVYERDGWTCQLCGDPVDPDLDYPDPACASLDHVVPLSRGGTHDSTNLQLAHLRCNYAAGDRKDDQAPRPPLVVDGADYYRPGEAAEIIGVTGSVLDTAMRRGRVPYVRTAGGRRLLAADVVADLAATGVPRREQQRKARPTTRAVVCRWCGEQVDVPVGLKSPRAYCSDQCLRESRKVRKRVGRRSTITPCAVCGTPVEHEVNGPKVRLCSDECVAQRRSDLALARRAAEYEPRECKVCGGDIPLRTERGRYRATCSDECAACWPSMRTARAAARRRSSGQLVADDGPAQTDQRRRRQA